jgi:hypothetical protein
MDMQKMFSLISRTADTSSALTIPHHVELVELIKGSEHAERIYAGDDVAAYIDNIRNSQYATVSEKRSMTDFVLRRIVVVLCEEQGLDLMYRYPNQQRSLHVGLVIRETHTGTDAVYGIRDCDPHGDDDPVYEYLPVDSNRLFDAIQWRMRDARRASIYGWPDPKYINKPAETVYVG